MKYLQDLQNDTRGTQINTPEYLIQENDNLYVDIKSMNLEVNQLFSPSKSINNTGGTQSDFGQESSQYLNGYLVNQNGMIQLPVLGLVKVKGLSEESARDTIQKKVEEYYKDATVKLRILTYKITVLGEVRNPGVFYNYNKNITILEALGLANGTTDDANLKKILVIRSTGATKKSFRLDLTGKKVIASDAYYLLPNDVLYIEPDRYKNTALNSTIFSLSLAAISSTILVLNYLQNN